MAKVHCVHNGCLQKVGLGEGPHWDYKQQKLIWLDIFDRWDQTRGKRMHIYDPQADITKNYDISGNKPITSVIPRENSNTSVAVTFGRNFGFYDLEVRLSFMEHFSSHKNYISYQTGKYEIIKTVDDEKPDNRFNDGKCDKLGRYWAGTMGPEPVALQIVPEQGSMYCLNPTDCSATWHYDKLNISNGIAWTNDDKKMFHVDSSIGKIYGFDFDLKTGELSNKTVAIEVDPKLGVPDGMCMDTEDKLWVAIYGGGQVIRYDPSTGATLTSVKIPAVKTTSCCWGGENLDELYVTSEGYSGDNPKDDPLGGSLFRVTNLNCKGTKANNYNG